MEKSKSALSIFVFGLYVLVLGILLMLVPNFMLRTISGSSTTEVWIRVVGLLLVCLGFYYTQAARTELADFFRWTVYTRSTVIVFFTAFVLLGFAKPQLIMFGLIDFLGAVWTGPALRFGKSA